MFQQPVDVHMHQRRSSRPPRLVDPRQHVGRRGHRALDIHALGDTLGQCRLSGSQRTAEHHDIARREASTDPFPELQGVLRRRQCHASRFIDHSPVRSRSRCLIAAKSVGVERLTSRSMPSLTISGCSSCTRCPDSRTRISSL
ncbi:Uncharacterised protein [Mycobacteroides abscessus subsp. abscessus]|nr:Uncharacterised protein [Mycobacteroides abscessus subsp. abscessus]